MMCPPHGRVGLVDNEVLYFAREQSRDEQKRIHYLLVDASASMRGDRQTFARGMAIATGGDW